MWDVEAHLEQNHRREGIVEKVTILAMLGDFLLLETRLAKDRVVVMGAGFCMYIYGQTGQRTFGNERDCLCVLHFLRLLLLHLLVQFVIVQFVIVQFVIVQLRMVLQSYILATFSHQQSETDFSSTATAGTRRERERAGSPGVPAEPSWEPWRIAFRP